MHGGNQSRMCICSCLTGRCLMNLSPGAAQLPRGTEARLLCHSLRIKICLAKQFLRVRNAQKFAVFGDGHAHVFVK
jgi:hypothetical protein